jgi:hypothetical protein
MLNPTTTREIEAEKDRAEYEVYCWRIALQRGDSAGWSCAAARRRLLDRLGAAEARAAFLAGRVADLARTVLE